VPPKFLTAPGPISSRTARDGPDRNVWRITSHEEHEDTKGRGGRGTILNDLLIYSLDDLRVFVSDFTRV
jgi:hypothetical protein